MNKNRNLKIISYIVITLLSFAILIPSFSAKADIGPKPSMHFDFQFPQLNFDLHFPDTGDT